MENLDEQLDMESLAAALGKDAEEHEEDRRARIATDIRARLKEITGQTFMLTGPETLTVKIEESGYKKRPHIGGEEFTVEDVYLGKKGDLIFVFEPISPEGYDVMEMKEADARRSLSGFNGLVDVMLRGAMTELRQDRQESARTEELKRNENLFDVYAEQGFGSF
jgi:hypothetical protein